MCSKEILANDGVGVIVRSCRWRPHDPAFRPKQEVLISSSMYLLLGTMLLAGLLEGSGCGVSRPALGAREGRHWLLHQAR